MGGGLTDPRPAPDRADAALAAAGAATQRAKEAEDLLRAVVAEYGHLCALPDCLCAIARAKRHVG